MAEASPTGSAHPSTAGAPACTRLSLIEGIVPRSGAPPVRHPETNTSRGHWPSIARAIWSAVASARPPSSFSTRNFGCPSSIVAWPLT